MAAAEETFPWLDRVSALFADGFEPRAKVVVSLLLLVALWLLRGFALRAIERRESDPATSYRWRKSSLYLGATLTVLLLGLIWFEEFRSLATFLGLLTAGLAIALKDLVTSFAGWIFILVRKPFEVGDRIQIGAHAGDVIDLRIFKFTLMEIGNWVDADQSTGRVIHIPNSQVLSEALVNYTRGFEFIWNEIPVLVTFESDWLGAKAILREIAELHSGESEVKARKSLTKAARRFMLYYQTLTPTVYTSVRDSGVLLTVRHLCEPRRRRGITEAIWEDILRRFAERPDIDFAYPTQRFFDHLREGAGRPEAAGRDAREGPGPVEA